MAFQAALRTAGVPCDLVTIANGLHSMGNWTRIAPHYGDQVVQWLVQVLHVPKSGPAPTNLVARGNQGAG